METWWQEFLTVDGKFSAYLIFIALVFGWKCPVREAHVQKRKRPSGKRGFPFSYWRLLILYYVHVESIVRTVRTTAFEPVCYWQQPSLSDSLHPLNIDALCNHSSLLLPYHNLLLRTELQLVRLSFPTKKTLSLLVFVCYCYTNIPLITG